MWYAMQLVIGFELMLLGSNVATQIVMMCSQDAIFAKYRPGTFLPALCHVFMDTDAPLEVLESAARAITYFLEVHVDSTARKVVEVSGAVKAFCKALIIFPSNDNVDPDSARVSR